MFKFEGYDKVGFDHFINSAVIAILGLVLGVVVAAIVLLISTSDIAVAIAEILFFSIFIMAMAGSSVHFIKGTAYVWRNSTTEVEENK